MNLERKGILFVVSGPSGAGKSSIIGRALASDPRVSFSVSFTTRAPREGETEGIHYHFVDETTFRNMIDEDRFFEWQSVHGHMYGTPKQGIVNQLEKGYDMFLDIDVKGALNVRKECPRAVLVFVEPPSVEALRERLFRRGEREITTRMRIVGEEMEKKSFFDYTITNEDLDRAYRAFQKIVQQERERNDGTNHR